MKRLKSSDDVNDIVDLQKVDPRRRGKFEFIKLSRRVCIIERPDAAEATGFLVGPDLMLTAAHALRGTAGVFADPDTVTIKFDQFMWNQKRGIQARGDQCRLRELPFSRPKQPDVVASSIKVDPKIRRQLRSKDRELLLDNGLDYVLVRLDRPIGLSFLPLSYRIRGWNNVSRADVPAKGPVFVVQHPFGGFQKFAKGRIPDDYKDRDFEHLFRYHTMTLQGASGSPIVDEKRRVIGIHIGERSETEQLGVSFQPIFKDLIDEGVTLPRFHLDGDVMDSIFGTSRIERIRKGPGDWRGDRFFHDVYVRGHDDRKR